MTPGVWISYIFTFCLELRKEKSRGAYQMSITLVSHWVNTGMKLNVDCCPFSEFQSVCMLVEGQSTIATFQNTTHQDCNTFLIHTVKITIDKLLESSHVCWHDVGHVCGIVLDFYIVTFIECLTQLLQLSLQANISNRGIYFARCLPLDVLPGTYNFTPNAASISEWNCLSMFCRFLSNMPVV